MAFNIFLLRDFRNFSLNKKSVKKFFSSSTVTILNEVWASIQSKGQYSAAAKKVNSLLPKVNEKSIIHTDAVITAMVANSCARNPGGVRHLVKARPIYDVPLFKRKRALELLLHAYCVADNIICTETLLHDWFKVLYPDKDKVPVAASNIMKDLSSRHQIQNSESDNELKVKIEKIFDEMKASAEDSMQIPLRTWSSITRFYSHRKAWVQCLKILDYLEEEYPLAIAAHSPQPSKSINGRLLWHLLDAQCLLGRYCCHAYH